MPPSRRAPRRRTEREFRRVVDHTLPVTSVASGTRLMASIRAQCGDAHSDDLWLPYFYVSTSLTRARPMLHRRGPVAVAVRASVAVPGLFPPVPHDGEVLVDGSLVDNLPIAEMRRANPERHGHRRRCHAAQRASEPGDVRVLRFGLAGARRAAAPPTGAPARSHATLLRSMLVASSWDRDRAVEAGLADLHLQLDVRSCGPFDLDATEAVARAGYEQAGPRLATWLGDAGRPWAPPG